MPLAALALSGCTEEAKRGWMPAEPGTTNHTDALTSLWVHSWIAALAVGLITWGLLLWCLVAYRRRKNDVGFPRQISYNLPLEILYTALPLFMVFVLFYFTDKTQRQVDARVENPDVKVKVFGKQWAWDFNYDYQGEKHYFQGTQAHLSPTGETGVEKTLPTLYLPENKSVEFQLESRDVIHSFWIPQFLQKRDMIPGHTNYITLTPQRAGTYQGKCAELCGEYHSEMLFNVVVLPEDQFKAKMAELPKGEVGEEYNRKPTTTNSN
nr:cytochrome c oxidase subunit II [Falsarthrobacter nasiphocae]